MQITRFVLLTVALAVGGCGAPAAPLASSSTPPVSPRAASASVPAGTSASPPTQTPTATLAASSEDASDAPPGAISVDMGIFGPPRFDPDEVTVKSGKVSFFLRNVGDQYEGHHDFVIGPALYQGLARSPAIKGGDAVILTIEALPAGDYMFWCEVERHASLGMVGALRVDP